MQDWAGNVIKEAGKYKCKVCEHIFEFAKDETYPICSNCGNYAWVKV
ncbi:MAG: hypothetical protein HY361_02380 [Candidatus Aenigmarchaeota archaeon]|nr:hypothetical protein [Candidatus Aenigmarchaeota archaeon]